MSGIGVEIKVKTCTKKPNKPKKNPKKTFTYFAF